MENYFSWWKRSLRLSTVNLGTSNERRFSIFMICAPRYLRVRAQLNNIFHSFRSSEPIIAFSGYKTVSCPLCSRGLFFRVLLFTCRRSESILFRLYPSQVILLEHFRSTVSNSTSEKPVKDLRSTKFSISFVFFKAQKIFLAHLSSEPVLEATHHIFFSIRDASNPRIIL